MSDFSTIFFSAPPIARTITAASVLLSVPAHMGVIEFYYLVFAPYLVFTFRTIPQIWRCFTTFVLTGPKLGLILDPYFLYTYLSALETTATRFSGPGDLFVYLVFVCTIILLLGGVYLGGFMLLSPLTLALAYTFAQEDPNRQMSYIIITFQAKWLPLVMLAMTFVMESPGSALVQSSGLVAAHAYEFVMKIWPEYGGGRKLISTPQFVARWFAPEAGTASQRGAGTAFAARPASGAQNVPQQRQGGGGGGGWASGFSGGGGNWGERGPGRRLG